MGSMEGEEEVILAFLRCLDKDANAFLSKLTHEDIEVTSQKDKDLMIAKMETFLPSLEESLALEDWSIAKECEVSAEIANEAVIANEPSATLENIVVETAK